MNWTLVALFAVLTLIALSVVKLRRDVQKFRDELHEHRLEIVSALDHRVEDLKELHDTAAALNVRTAEIAAALAKKTQEGVDEAAARHEQLSAEVGLIKTTLEAGPTTEHIAEVGAEVDVVKEIVTDTRQRVKSIIKKPSR